MNREKLKALVQYICFRCSDPSLLGKTKLNKVLYYSDFAAYVRLKASITGEQYVKHQFGPVALRQPSLALFSADEISLVDEMIEVICYQHSARSISEASHTRVWEAAHVGEEIPYSSAFIHRLRSISPDDLDWARLYIERRA